MVLAAALAFLFSPKLTAAPMWRATVTPLASIIGSGFLVSFPLLTHDLGSYSVIAMACLVVFAYLLGGAIRFNILHGEPLFAEGGRRWLSFVERTSHLALALAYFISVTYYLTLLSAFLLKGLGTPHPLAAKGLTTAILLGIAAQGLWRGLHGLESVEEYAVGLKLAIIAAALAALAWFNIDASLNGTWHIVEQTKPFDWQSARVVLGLLVVVQGFETSRFLAGAYPPEMRVRTMRYAQWLSGAIYMAFFLLAMAAVDDPRALNGNATGIIAVLQPAASSLVYLIVIGAVFAQLSAAVADSIGAGGLIEQVTGRRIDHHHAYPVIAVIGIALTWTLDVFAVITLASRAFALFYLLQCLVAAGVALKSPDVRQRGLDAAGFLALAAMALAVVLFGIPMEGI
ncbi:MAG TPA: hypothetical protein VMW57_09715 [Methyloceanibacter sp.]|nr:hypothetical protein [Methyloceanibacter sp.]